jgi:hypothetical protein
MVYFYGDILRSQATAELAIESQTVLRKIIDDTRLADAIRTTNQITDANAPVGGWTTNDPSDILIIATPAVTAARDIIYDPSDKLPYENEAIYFKANGTFYRRISNLSNLSFIFYDINNTSTSNATLARSIAVTITLQRKIYGTATVFDNTIRTTLRNY